MSRPTIVMFHRYAFALLSALCVLLGSAHADEPEPYRIQPGDVLVVAVWKEQDLMAEVLVRPDGGMSFPLVGDVRASGRTVEELRTLVDERLSKFIPDPSVTIAVKQIGGNRVYVLGKVNRPGEFTFSRPIDVMQALSLAGGATSFAALDDIQILRRDPAGKQTSRRFRYSEVERGRDLEQNILLKSGDTVRIVPSSSAVSGMTLVAVPAAMRPTVTTAGSNTSTRRVTYVCSACTISQATGIGSFAWCGIDACPPRPRTVTRNSSADASSAPARVATTPAGNDGDWWMANAHSTGPPPSAAAITPSSMAMRAPAWPSSPGWNRNRTRPAISPARSASSRAAPASMAQCASWPQACMAPATAEA